MIESLAFGRLKYNSGNYIYMWKYLKSKCKDNRTLGIQWGTKSTNSGPEVRPGRGFEGTCTGKERAGLGKAPTRCDDSTWEGREAGWDSHIVGYIVCGSGKGRPLSTLNRDRTMMGMTSREMSPSGFISGDGQAREIFCPHLKKTT